MQVRDTVVCVFEELDDVYDAIAALREAGFEGNRIGFALAEDAIEAPPGDRAAPADASVPVRQDLVAALAGAGLTHEEASWYEAQLRRGAALVSVQASGRADEARAILLDYGGMDYDAVRGVAEGRPWHEIAPRVQTQLGLDDATWRAHEPAHRFGYEAAQAARERGEPARWSAHAPRLRQAWTAEEHGPWDQHEGAIRRGFDVGRGRWRFDEYPYTGRARTIGAALASASTGAVVGGLVGGPVGLVAGVVIGGALGALAGSASDAGERPGE